MIFITPQFDRNISKVKQFYCLKIVSQYLKDKYKKTCESFKGEEFFSDFI